MKVVKVIASVEVLVVVVQTSIYTDAGVSLVAGNTFQLGFPMAICAGAPAKEAPAKNAQQVTGRSEGFMGNADFPRHSPTAHGNASPTGKSCLIRSGRAPPQKRPGPDGSPGRGCLALSVGNQARSKRSRFITLFQAAMKS